MSFIQRFHSLYGYTTYKYFLYAVVDCGPLEDPINGLVDTSAGTTFGSTAIYSCSLNFMVNGSSTRFCTAEGVWGGQAPVCVGKNKLSLFFLKALSTVDLEIFAVKYFVVNGTYHAKCIHTH